MTSRTQLSLFPLALWPVVAFAITLPFLSTLDLSIASFFYSLYPHFDVPLAIKLAYHYGPFPAVLLGLMAIALLVVNIRPVWQKYRTSALMLFLVLLIAPGLLITSLNKYTFRPKPFQTENFGGTHSFTSISKITAQSGNKPYHSFPSKRVSIAFFLLALWRVALRERKEQLAKYILILSSAAIAAFSWVSMARGGHFFSDILFSGLITWLTILSVELYCYGTQFVQVE
mgnify:CR=1 FL=1